MDLINNRAMSKVVVKEEQLVWKEWLLGGKASPMEGMIFKRRTKHRGKKGRENNSCKGLQLGKGYRRRYIFNIYRYILKKIQMGKLRRASGRGASIDHRKEFLGDASEVFEYWIKYPCPMYSNIQGCTYLYKYKITYKYHF